MDPSWLQPSFTTWDSPSSSTIPGSPADQANKLRGPWMETQLALAVSVGLISFFTFCLLRTRSRVLYAPRTLLKGFSPHEVHSKSTFFGWILPTLRTSEFTVLQIVGLDAAVLLQFFKSSFYFFGTCTLLAAVVLVPINFRENGTTEGVPPPADDDDDDDGDSSKRLLLALLKKGDKGGAAPFHGSTLYLTSHLVFTYIFSLLALYQLYRTYRSFLHTRQLFALDHALSIPARTVLITSLPHHLRSERLLAQYWEDLGLRVESVAVGRNVGSLRQLINERTAKLLALEHAWMQYVGNPVSKRALEAGYDRDEIVSMIMDDEEARQAGAIQGELSHQAEDARLVDISPPASPTADRQNDVEVGVGQQEENKFRIKGRARPQYRTSWLTTQKVDLLDHLAFQYRRADEAVRRRREGRFKPASVAFVTFEDLGSAQIAAQVTHYPQPNSMITDLAPDPRDIHWHNMLLSPSSVMARQILVYGALVLLLLFWAVPVAAVSRLLNYEVIKRNLPWLARLINRSPRIQVLVQNSLPSLALIGFNNLLPFILDWLSILQGISSRSEIEYSLLRKYHFFLVVNVFFLVVTVSTVDLAKDLANEPISFISKMALSLPGARNFFQSYVILAGIGIMPLQLVQLAVIIPRWFYRIFYTKTPRDFAELNTPPQISLGSVYPQALLIFQICLTFSVIAPMILLFGTIYFGMGYLVYKYKLLFVHFRPYESRGQAWPISFDRVCTGLVIFQLFMLGLFLLREAALLAILMAPLLLFTVYTSFSLHNRFQPLSKFVNLAQAAEVKRAQSTEQTPYEAGALASDVERLRKGHPVTPSQSELNRGRYESSGETMYVVKQDSKTDYQQPPMSEAYYGILNTGQRRYNHPALSGRLPLPWLPAGKSEYVRATNRILPDSAELEEVQQPLDLDLSSSGAIIIDIRRRFQDLRNVAKRVVVRGIERMQSPDPPSSRGGHRGEGRRSSQQHSVSALRDDEDYINDSTNAWARSSDGLLGSPTDTSVSSRHPQDGHEDSDEEAEGGAGSRYVFYPHRQDGLNRGVEEEERGESDTEG